MRRILVSVFATIATFTVLANNFIPVSAPASDGVSLQPESAPQGMARLFEQPVYTPVASVPGGPMIVEAQPQPDLAAFAPHTIAEVETNARPEISASQQAVTEKPYLNAWSQAPGTTVESQKLGSIPNTIGTEILSGKPADHVAVNSVSEGSVERMNAMPDAGRISSVPEYVAAVTDGPIDFFNPRSLIEVPTSITDQNILSGSKEHQIAQAANSTVAERTSFNADSIFVPRVPEFVAATYQAPETIFQRARFVVEPAARSTEILSDRAQHIPGYTTGTATPERTAMTAEKAWLPAFVSTVSEITASVFGREKIAVPADTLTSTDVLNDKSEHTAINDSETPNAERTTANAEKAFLPSFVAAVTEIASSVIGRETIEVPIETVSTDVLASNENHDANGNVAASIERQSQPVAAEKAPTLASFVSTLAIAPSAVFQKMGLLPMPEETIKSETILSGNSDHTIAANTTAVAIDQRETATPDAAIAPVKTSPVLISTDTAMNANMLKPMSAGPLVNAPMPNENAIASTGYNATPFDRMIVSPDVPEAVLKAQPTLISSKTEFSSDLLKPMNAVASNPFVSLTKEEIVAAAQQRDNYCDPNFVGPPIRFSQTVELKLDDLLRQLHQRFGVNFIVGPSVADKPMNIKAGSIPWNVLLKSQLFISGVRARCIDANTIELVENATLPSLQDQADVETRFLKLKFLQRTGGGTVDLANRSQGGQSGNQGGGCGGNNQGGTSGSVSSGGGQGGGQQGQTVGQQSSNKFDKLIVEIEKILGLRSMQESSSGGSSGGGGGSQSQQREAARSNRFVTQIPGRNILAIRATKEEHELIDQIVARADRAPFQVVIKGLVYTANQDKLRDIGVSTTITGGTANNRTNGGIFGDTLGVGTLFDFSTVIGTFDFNVQATAFQQNGVISVKSRPFATVIDGLCTTLDVGRQLPIVIDSSLGGAGDVVFVNAANNLAVTPYVIDDENGNPVAVTLELRLTANDIDSSVTARGVPAISARSIQTQLLLNEDKTAILGGFTVDSDSRSVQKTPGLGDIPLIGELFKRRTRDTRVNRLYFAVSVDILPYPEPIRPVDVPGADTNPPSITPEQKKRADAAEPKQVKGP